MDVTAKSLVLLLSAAAIGACAESTTTEPAGHPYKAIPARNVFGLKDPPPPPDPNSQKPPLPKITLQGIATILGRKQVLFKVAADPKPGQPPSELSLVLSPGEAQNDVEVLEIDEAAGSVKFKNHGVEETKTLKDDSAKPGGGTAGLVNTLPAMTSPNIPRPLMPMPNTATPSVPAGLQQIPTRASAKLQAAGEQLPPQPPPPGQ